MGKRRQWQVLNYLLFLLVIVCCNAQEGPNFALQVEPFKQPVGDRNKKFRQNLCNLSLQVVAGSIPLDDALQGVDLNVLLADGPFANLDYDTITTQDNTTIVVKESVRLNEQYAGLVPDILDHVCEKAGCRWRNSYYPLFYPEVMTPNKTFNELLYWAVDMYDLLADYWIRSIERLANGTSYAEKWYDGSIIMVTKKQIDSHHDTFDPWGWLAPFDSSVWWLILATILFSSLVYWFLEWLNPNTDTSGGKNTVLAPSHIAWMTGTAFAGQFEFMPQTGPARLFTFSIAFWSLLMTSAYTANLASFLVMRNNTNVRIDTVKQAVEMGKTMCVWATTQSDLTISADFPVYAASGLLKRQVGEASVFHGLKSGVCEIAVTYVSAWETYQKDLTVNGDCDLEQMGQPYNNVPGSFTLKSDSGTRCTSLLRDALNLYMFEMELTGEMTRLWEKYTDETASVNCEAKLAADAADDDAEARRRLLTKHQDEIHAAAAIETDGRQLKPAAARAGAAGGGAEAAAANGDGFNETTKLSLINMGGVFMLHGILSAISILIALVPFFYSRFYAEHGRRSTKGTNSASTEEEEEVQFTSARALFGGHRHHEPSVHQRRRRARSLDTAQSSARYVDVLEMRDEINDKLAEQLSEMSARIGELNAKFSRLEQHMGGGGGGSVLHSSRPTRSVEVVHGYSTPPQIPEFKDDHHHHHYDDCRFHDPAGGPKSLFDSFNSWMFDPSAANHDDA